MCIVYSLVTLENNYLVVFRFKFSFIFTSFILVLPVLFSLVLLALLIPLALLIHGQRFQRNNYQRTLKNGQTYH